MPRMKLVIVPLLLSSSLLSSPLRAEPLRARSGAAHVSLVELYTSEGCSSCPPVDELVDALAARAPDRIAALAFHVDYWDQIGWPDRFASPRWSARQRARSPSLYTPELLLDGREVARERLTPAVGPPRAPLELELDGAQVTVRAHGGRRLFLALTESALVVQVAAGENRGRTLRHDHVVRELYGPFDAARPAVQAIAVAPGWNRAALALVAFVEDEHGEVLEALRLPLRR
jgi:hypothetical protein